jgi:O-antigen/teichoic acid export membrane protein
VTERDASADNRAVARTSVALLASRVAISGMGWFGSILIARLLSPEGWGEFSFVFGLLGLLSIVTDLGVGRVVLARLLDSDAVEVARVAGAFVALRVLLGLVGYAVAMGYVLLFGYPMVVVQATAVAGVVVVVATPSHALSVLFQSRLRMTVVAVAEAAGQSVQLLLTVLAALWAPQLLVFVLPFVANEVVQLGMKLRRVRRGDAGSVSVRQVQLWRWRGMLVDALPLTVGIALTTLLYKIDVLLLSRFDTFDSVGLYSVGYKFADVLVLVAVAVVSPAMTLLVAAWPANITDFRRRTRQLSAVLALLGALAVAGFWSVADPLITLLYGGRFGSATDAARLLVLGGALAMLTYVGFTVLVAAGRQRLYPWVGAVGLPLNVILNLVLIPPYSFSGAAVATIITEVAVLVMIWVLVARTVAVPGLLPLGRLGGLAVVTAAVVGLSQLTYELAPWPVRALGCVLGVLGAAWALDYPGVRSLPGTLRAQLGRERVGG